MGTAIAVRGDGTMDRVLDDILGMTPAFFAGLAVFALADPPPGATVVEIKELFESQILTLVCVVGASFGGLFNLYFFGISPEEKNPSQARLFQFLVACLLGVCLASPVLHWTHQELNITWVLFVSAMSATFGIMLIRGLMPTLKSLFSSPLEKIITFLQSVRGK